MASLIDEDRREHYETLQIRKRRADKVNQTAFWFSLCGAVIVGLSAFMAIGGNESERRAILPLTAAAVLFFIGCLKRVWWLNIAAAALYVLACLLGTQMNPFYFIPMLAAFWANLAEYKLSKEEGYPQFSLDNEERERQAEMAHEIQYAVKNAKEAQISSSEMDELKM